MIKTELLEIITNGENSGVEFKRDNIPPEKLASREQQLRLLQEGGLLHIEMLPVSGTSVKDIDLRRFEYYLVRVIEDNVIPTSSRAWQERLKSLDLIIDTDFARSVGSIAGILLFSKKPGRFLPNAGFRVTVYPGVDKDYNAAFAESVTGTIPRRLYGN